MRSSLLARRWLPLAGLCLCLGAVAAVGGGVLPLHAPQSSAQGKPDPTPPGRPTSEPPKDSGSEPGSASTPEAPPPDPRIERALSAKVCLQAGKAKLWSDLRRLGVKLEWPESNEPHWTLDEPLFQRGLRRLARRAERAPRNARLLHQNGTFKVLPGRPGQRLDRTEAEFLIKPKRAGLDTLFIVASELVRLD